MSSKVPFLLSLILLFLVSCKSAENTLAPNSEVNTDKIIYGQQPILPADLKMPTLKGGLKALHRKVEYPERARKNNIQGRVLVSFVVNKEGKAQDFKVIEGLGFGCTEAAIKAIEQSSFEPARKKGEPVNFMFAMPITFSLY